MHEGHELLDASGGEVEADGLRRHEEAEDHHIDEAEGAGGEVAGGEIIDMFKAMQMAKGSLSTTHAYTAAGAVDRLVTCALEAGVPTEYAYRQVAHHINLIIQLQTDYEFADTGDWETF